MHSMHKRGDEIWVDYESLSDPERRLEEALLHIPSFSQRKLEISLPPPLASGELSSIRQPLLLLYRQEKFPAIGKFMSEGKKKVLSTLSLFPLFETLQN